VELSRLVILVFRTFFVVLLAAMLYRRAPLLLIPLLVLLPFMLRRFLRNMQKLRDDDPADWWKKDQD